MLRTEDRIFEVGAEVWDVGGELIVAVMAGFYSVAELDFALARFLPFWGLFHVILNVGVKATTKKERVFVDKNTQQLSAVCQFVSFILEVSLCLYQVEQFNYHISFFYCYLAFSIRALSNLLIAIVELMDLNRRSKKINKNGGMEIEDLTFNGLPEEYSDVLGKEIIKERKNMVVGGLDFLGWMSLVCGSPFGWIFIATAVSIKIGYVGYQNIYSLNRNSFFHRNPQVPGDPLGERTSLLCNSSQMR